mgnify:CR=1 FL=1
MTPDSGPEEFFTHDHRAIDAIWAEVEAAADQGDDAVALSAWKRFDAALSRHFEMEEEVLFPAMEAAGLPPMGPTRMMRMEHEQMRGLLRHMDTLAEAGDSEGLADEGDTLLMIIQQHNAKEEGILYPMAARLLGSQWDQIAARIARY